MKISKEDYMQIEENVRKIANEFITPLPQAQIISMLLLASSTIGANIMGKQPESVEESKLTLLAGVKYLTDYYDNIANSKCNKIDAAITFHVGHA